MNGEDAAVNDGEDDKSSPPPDLDGCPARCEHGHRCTAAGTHRPHHYTTCRFCKWHFVDYNEDDGSTTDEGVTDEEWEERVKLVKNH